MKEYQALTEGQRVYITEDLKFVQDQILKALQDQYKDLGNFVIQGCELSGTPGNYSLSGGLVYIDGRFRVLDAIPVITFLPVYIVPVVNDESPRAFLLGPTKDVVKDYSAVVQGSPGGAGSIQITTDGARRYVDAIKMVRLEGNQTIAGEKKFSTRPKFGSFDLLSEAQIVNDLSSINTNLALSANQGRILNDTKAPTFKARFITGLYTNETGSPVLVKYFIDEGVTAQLQTKNNDGSSSWTTVRTDTADVVNEIKFINQHIPVGSPLVMVRARLVVNGFIVDQCIVTLS